jgi:hypothetical protein
MELDELKTSWTQLNRNLERQLTLNVEILREGKLRDARTALQPLQRGQWVQILGGVLFMLIFAPVWAANLGTIHLMLPALLVHAYGLAMVLSAARILVLIDRVDYAQPVVDIQRRLAELRAWRARIEQPLFAVLGCFIWIPMTLVALNAAGADVWVKTPLVVYGDIASGFVCLGVVYAVLWGVRKNGSERARTAVENSFVGNSIRKAQSQLQEIERFEQGV